ncbi:hypothetical protein GGU11DRAFT_812689 [Lentinula aff. detonsa]|nr:hypothetical protein GGU11DRAFT_812689 [Lentinula aff. detonsa]
MSFSSDPQSFRQYALSLPNDPYEPYDASDSEAHSEGSDVESIVSNDYSDTSDADNWDEILRQADPRYRHRFLRHMMDYYANPDGYTGPYDYSDSEFNYSHDSLANSTHSSDSFHSAHSSIAGSESGESSHDNGSESSSEPPDYMGPDGRLLESERERCRNLSLCFYCGGDHFCSHCPKLRAKYSGDSDASKIPDANRNL